MYIFSNVIARLLALVFAALYALGGAPWSTPTELPQAPYPAELPAGSLRGAGSKPVAVP